MGFVDNTPPPELTTRVVSVTHSDGKSGRLPMGNGCCDSGGGFPKYKRRRVSAVRDFPPGCGRFAPRISSTPNEQEAFCVGVAQNLVDNSGDAFGEGTKTENLPTAEMVSSEKVDGSDSVNVAPVKVPLPGDSDALRNAGNGEQMKTLDPEKFEVPKGLSQPDANGPPQHVPRKYPPPRRISAVRDFPPFCGRNAPRLVKEGLEVLASTENKSLGQEKSGVEKELMKEAVKTAAKRVGGDIQNGDVHKGSQAEVETSLESEMSVIHKGLLEESIKSARKSIQNQCEFRLEGVPESGKRSIGDMDDNLGMNLQDSMMEKSSERKLLDLYGSTNPVIEDDTKGLELVSDTVIVQGLMATGNDPLRQEKRVHVHNNFPGDIDESEGKKNNFILQERPKVAVRTTNNDVENYGGAYMKKKKEEEKKNSSPSRKAYQGTGEVVLMDSEDDLDHGGGSDNFQLVKRSHNFDVTLPPSYPTSLSGKDDDSDAIVTRNKVRETLRLFQVVYRKLVKEEEAKLKHIKRPDCVAAAILRKKGKYVNKKEKFIGPVPGVEVGDEFQYRVELNIIGLHRQTQGGIDFVKEGGRIIATSIVASGGYDDDMDDSDVLIYTGAGGLKSSDKDPEDQKLERGNLALKNSVDAKNPVRVIRGEMRVSETSSGKSRTYIYDGLYLVEKCWQEMGVHGKLVFRFKLVRIPGQPELAWKVVNKSKKFKVREDLCVDDISKGKELIPICAVNTIDDEKPPPFEYITHVIYPDWCRPIPPRGCDCTNGCSETGNCSCADRNGGEIPYNHNGAIVEAKRLVYECGPSCKCPPSCYNRVTQHGIKFQLEIFKTESRGWGVRSLNSIPSGSFICEYVGELLEEKEADQRTGNDEYLFDIGNNCNDNSLWDGLSNLLSKIQSNACEVEENCFTIDAAKYGNVGRFINHSCSPNLYAQNLLYDHEDKRIPHIMLFAAENIPPLQELTYHYNYTIDEVLDSNGNIKTKICYCGSSECTGRMY